MRGISYGGIMYQLVYVSSATKPFSSNELRELLAVAEAANAIAGITGALLYSEGNFIQVLEGPEEAVKETYERICGDPRHRGILKLLGRPIEERSFPGWAMGSPRLRPEDAARVPEWRCWNELAASVRAGHARTLIEVFCRQNG